MTGRPLPTVLVVLDGLADRAHAAFDGRTANEVATTPVLDRLVSGGSVGLLHALGPGRAPSSELAHWAMLGYRDEEFCGRAILEARGRAIPIVQGSVCAFAALRSSERRDGVRWLTGRAGPEHEELSRTLIARLAGIDRAVRVTDLGRGEAIAQFDDLTSPDVTDSESLHEAFHPMLAPLALSDAGRASAAAFTDWTRQAHAAIAGTAFDSVTLKWPGVARQLPPFDLRHGIAGPLIGGSPFLMGLAETLGLRPLLIPDTGDVGNDLRRRLELAARSLAAGATFALVHTKAPDEAGHTKSPETKRATIERLDGVLASLEKAPFEGAIVCVTGDHATPACGAAIIHSGDPVPIVIRGPGVLQDDVRAFGERAAAHGLLGRLTGSDLMPVLLNAAARPSFLGTRTVADRHAQGLALNPVPWLD